MHLLDYARRWDSLRSMLDSAPKGFVDHHDRVLAREWVEVKLESETQGWLEKQPKVVHDRRQRSTDSLKPVLNVVSDALVSQVEDPRLHSSALPPPLSGACRYDASLPCEQRHARLHSHP